MTDEKLLKFLKENKELVTATDRMGNIVNIYLKNDFRIQRVCSSKEKALKVYTMYRRELEDIYV